MSNIVGEESVKLVGSELGLDVEGVCSQVAGEVEFQIRKVVEDACKFMRKGRRQRLSPGDINNALSLRGESFAFGYSRLDKLKWSKLNQELMFVEDEDVSLSSILDACEKVFLPSKLPLKVSYGIHWLAIDGVQPTTQENPRIYQNESKLIPDSTKEKSSMLSDKKDGDIASHALSRELQLYFDKVISAVLDCARGNRGAAEAVYASLAVDRGLQALMPYLSKFIFDQINKSLSNLNILLATMRLTKCILVNPNLEEESYLQQLLPPILTCIVHSKLCSSPFLDHWSLRDFSSTLIPIVFAEYGELYSHMKPRVTKTLYDALCGSKTKKKALTTQYGAIVGISAMGPLSVQSVLLPLMKPLFIRYHKILAQNITEIHSVEKKYEIMTIKRTEAQNCVGALQSALGIYLRAQSVPALSKALLLQEHLEILYGAAEAAGESVIPWTPACDRSSHLNLFI